MGCNYQKSFVKHVSKFLFLVMTLRAHSLFLSLLTSLKRLARPMRIISIADTRDYGFPTVIVAVGVQNHAYPRVYARYALRIGSRISPWPFWSYRLDPITRVRSRYISRIEHRGKSPTSFAIPDNICIRAIAILHICCQPTSSLSLMKY